jgi:hypothetical protein
MQAIITKYIAPTNFKGARIRAKCERGAITLSWDHGGGVEFNHVGTAQALVAKFVAEDAVKYGTKNNPWEKPRACGQIPSGEFVHVFIP